MSRIETMNMGRGMEQFFGAEDLLRFGERAKSYAQLIRTISDGRVISIEAGFGQGKSFFAQRWAKYLRAEGDTVIEIDAWRSEQSGDPLLNFVGALVQTAPASEPGRGEQARKAAMRVLAGTGKIVINAVARGAADEIAGMFQSDEGGTDPGSEISGDIIRDAGDALAKRANTIIAEHMALNAVRQELPNRIADLRTAITGAKDGRIIVIVDELDRCHPDYAIALLEAMKHVFDQPGFVFCLMVNSRYLEALAERRFGTENSGESYLEKFVDIRLNLPDGGNNRALAAETFVRKLPKFTPFREHDAFGLENAAQLAGRLAVDGEFSMRQIKRTLLTVEIALRTHPEKPLDPSLLVGLAFEKCGARGQHRSLALKNYLPRAVLDSDLVNSIDLQRQHKDEEEDFFQSAMLRLEDKLNREYGMFFESRVDFGLAGFGGARRVLHDLADSYVPEHKAVLDAAFDAQVEPNPL